MNFKICKIIVILLCLVSFISCNDDEKATIKVSTQEIQLDKSGRNASDESAEFEVTSDKSWVLTCASWLTTSSIWGNEGVTVLSVYASGTDEDRKGYITVQSGDVRTVITVNQSAEELVASTLTVLSAPSVEANGKMSDGSKPIVSFSTNKRWTITGLPAWITANPASGSAGTATITLTVSESDYFRDAGISINAGSLTEVVEIEQKGKLPYRVYPVQITGAQLGSVTLCGNYWEFMTNGNVESTLLMKVEADVSSRNGMFNFEYQVDSDVSAPMSAWFTSDMGVVLSWIPAAPLEATGGVNPNIEAQWKTFTMSTVTPIGAGWGDHGVIRFNFQMPTVYHGLIRNPMILSEL